MIGSTSRAGGVTTFSTASDSVMLWATVNAVTTNSSCPHAAPEQQQADEKQQVIGSDQDVVHARRDEPLEHRPDALPGAEEVLVLGLAAAEDGLRRQLGVLVDVEESLVIRVVGEQLGRHGHRADPVVERKPRLQSHGLPLAQDLRRRPAVQRERAPVDRQPQPFADQRSEPFAPGPQDVGIQHQGRIRRCRIRRRRPRRGPPP